MNNVNNHSSILHREAAARIKEMGLAGNISASEIVIMMQTMSLSMDEALRLIMAQRGVAPATMGQ